MYEKINKIPELYMIFARKIPEFLARDSMLSALYAIARPSVCPSVCPSVRHTGGSVKDG